MVRARRTSQMSAAFLQSLVQTVAHLLIFVDGCFDYSRCYQGNVSCNGLAKILTSSLIRIDTYYGQDFAFEKSAKQTVVIFLLENSIEYLDGELVENLSANRISRDTSKSSKHYDLFSETIEQIYVSFQKSAQTR